MHETPSKTIVLIGAAQFSDCASPLDSALSPLDILEKVAHLAAHDCAVPNPQDLLKDIDYLALVRPFYDSLPGLKPSWLHYDNLPKSLANRLHSQTEHLFYAHTGGNTPQWLVNTAAEKIAAGEVRLALLAGAEAMRTMANAQRAGIALDWHDDMPGTPCKTGAACEIGDPRFGLSPHEIRHGLGLATHAYPIFENALAHHYGRSQNTHRKAIGRLLRQFADIADQNSLAQFTTPKNDEEIITPGNDNRMIAWPYTKAMCAQMYVDQGAALIMTSLAHARSLGVPDEKLVYLHGCADTTDKWFMSERMNFHSSPAIRVGARHAFNMAGIKVEDIRYFDLYSCFSCAVEIAADETGLSHDDPRGLTITGGLPFFGGPGNNYTMHAIAEMVTKLRENHGEYGFISGNGWFLTKHSFGIYSTTPPASPFETIPATLYQMEIDVLPSPAFEEHPLGLAHIESFTVTHDKNGPANAILFARMAENGARALATSTDSVLLAILETADDPIGLPVTLSQCGNRNHAALA